jgi:hypothetical protein
VRVDYTNVCNIDAADRFYLNQIMEREDIVLILAGLFEHMNNDLWAEDYLRKCYGAVTTDQSLKYCLPEGCSDLSQLTEVGNICLTIGDFLKIILQKEIMQQHIDSIELANVNTVTLTDGRIINLLRESFYMKDLEMPTLFPELYKDFIQQFKLNNYCQADNIVYRNQYVLKN